LAGRLVPGSVEFTFCSRAEKKKKKSRNEAEMTKGEGRERPSGKKPKKKKRSPQTRAPRRGGAEGDHWKILRPPETKEDFDQ